MIKDISYGLRMLRKNPGVSAIAILTLALGIGANTAIFSVVSAVLLNPLPYKEPDRLVSLWENVPQHGRWRAAPANFLDWKAQNNVFEDVVAFGGATATLTGDGDPEQISGTAVTLGYFEVVGVQPALGRAFQPEEYKQGQDRVVILGHALWQRRYGGDKNIINRTVVLDGSSCTVVGVMPAGSYPARPTTAGRIDFDESGQDFWKPMSYIVNLAAFRSGPHEVNNFFKQLHERVSVLPGVESATIAYDHPLQSNWLDSFEIEGRVAQAGSMPPSANFIPVGSTYFETVRAEILRGRAFTAQDDQDHPGVVVVNEAFVRHYFPNEDPLGRRLRPGPPGRIWDGERLLSFEIVGVVRDVKFDGLAAPSEPAYYLPASQAPLGDMTVLVRTTSDPRAVISSLRQAVWAIDPNQPLSNINTLEQIVSESIAQPRLNMLLMMLFGGLALLLSAVGIYGLLSYAVTQRTQELGIRMALGANVTDVLNLVLKQGMLLALIGEAIGLAGAFALTRLMSGLLFGVTPTDTTIFAGVVIVLTLTALFACYLPARRATKVDPLVALRYE